MSTNEITRIRNLNYREATPLLADPRNLALLEVAGMIAVRECPTCKERSVPVLGILHPGFCVLTPTTFAHHLRKPSIEVKEDNFSVAKRLAARFETAETYDRIRFWKCANESDIRLLKIGQLLNTEQGDQAYQDYLAGRELDPRE